MFYDFTEVFLFPGLDWLYLSKNKTTLEEAMAYIEIGDDQLWLVTLRGGAQGHGERDRPGLHQD